MFSHGRENRFDKSGSTYDEYVSELDSGHLVWSPVHESEDFWKENGIRIGQESGGKAVKCGYTRRSKHPC